MISQRKCTPTQCGVHTNTHTHKGNTRETNTWPLLIFSPLLPGVEQWQTKGLWHNSPPAIGHSHIPYADVSHTYNKCTSTQKQHTYTYIHAYERRGNPRIRMNGICIIIAYVYTYINHEHAYTSNLSIRTQLVIYIHILSKGEVERKLIAATSRNQICVLRGRCCEGTREEPRECERESRRTEGGRKWRRRE